MDHRSQIQASIGIFSPYWIIIVANGKDTESSSIRSVSRDSGWSVLYVGKSSNLHHWKRLKCKYSDNHFEDVTLEMTKNDDVAMVTEDTLRRVGSHYAMTHGAKFIYQMEDGSRFPEPDEELHLQDKYNGLVTLSPRFFNPFQHFLTRDSNHKDAAYKVCGNCKTPIIQHGLSSVQRAINEPAWNDYTSGPVTSDLDSPAVTIPVETFSFFETANTLYSYEAFWAMTLSSHVTDRSNSLISRLWLSIYIQKLLWETDDVLHIFLLHVVFKEQGYGIDSQINAYRKQNPMMLLCVQRWQCSMDKSFFQCAIDLCTALAQCGVPWILNKEDVTFWVKELVQMGYEEPTRLVSPVHKDRYDISKSATEANCRVMFAPNSKFRPYFPLAQNMRERYYLELPPNATKNLSNVHNQKWEYIKMVNHVCPVGTISENNSRGNCKAGIFFNDMLLLIVYNTPYYSNTKYIEALFRPLFPNIAHCGENLLLFQQHNKDLGYIPTFIEFPVEQGNFFYMCMVRAMQMGYRVRGYFQIGDDNLINLWNVLKLDKSIIWRDAAHGFLDPRKGPITWHWWNLNIGKDAYNAAIMELKHKHRDPAAVGVSHEEFLARTKYQTEGFLRGIADVMYIPSHYKQDFIYYLQLFYKHRLFVEIAYHMAVIGVASPSDIIFNLNTANLWFGDRDLPFRFYNVTHGILLHPLKLSKNKSVHDFCAIYINDIFKYMFDN